MTDERRWLMTGAVLLCIPALTCLPVRAEPAANPPVSSPAAPPAASPVQPAPAAGTAKASPKSPTSHPRRTLHDRLVEAETALAMAGNEKQAGEIADRAEGLRSRALTGSVQMLISDSHDALEKHDFQRAQDDLTSAITIQPDQSILYRQRAAIRLMAGDNNGAISDLGVELQADPGDPTAWGMLAEAEHDRNEPDAALQAFHQMILLNPKSPDSDKQLKKLEKARDGQQD
ncbi:tetratricopeptide repeat protein [Gluconobacter roseus]|uniref:tetratricopeptide repeat protein n=2 Tax=Gluconobacter roseus TaxID=586239 RepID=UPI001580D580|nr:tetratricopeptide repeat protein [Gluconobacter roseus]